MTLQYHADEAPIMEFDFEYAITAVSVFNKTGHRHIDDTVEH